MASDTGRSDFRTTKTWSNFDNKYFQYDIHPWVFFIGGGIILLGVILALIAGDAATEVFKNVQGWIANYTGWFFVLVMNIVLAFCVILIFTEFANYKIGGEEAEPEFSTMGWFSMLFSAGMGIGILFYGVAEPMFHYAANPITEPGTAESAKAALELTFLHWGDFIHGRFMLWLVLLLHFLDIQKDFPYP